ncbi:hypothetical protein [Arcobacter sp. LA11]|uniref:hypothetical protein n=1 Tax=Arcobacter sp. LA11 TaxID=1898176 RepID=UPI0009343448|nr:hypothetical protein [Arcobacter sp. LA11]
MKYKYILIMLLVFFSGSLFSASTIISNMEINKIRVVGDYSGTTFDNSIELWFTKPIVWPENINCTTTFRVYIDAKHNHLVSAAYMAFTSGKRITFYVDDQLPIRSGSCEVSYLDVLK